MKIIEQWRAGEPWFEVRAWEADSNFRVQRFGERDFAGLVTFPEASLDALQIVECGFGKSAERFRTAQDFRDYVAGKAQVFSFLEEIHLQRLIGPFQL